MSTRQVRVYVLIRRPGAQPALDRLEGRRCTRLAGRASGNVGGPVRATRCGGKPRAYVPKRKSAGGYHTTTADINDATKSIALCDRIKSTAFSLCFWFTAMFGGVA